MPAQAASQASRSLCPGHLWCHRRSDRASGVPALPNPCRRPSSDLRSSRLTAMMLGLAIRRALESAGWSSSTRTAGARVSGCGSGSRKKARTGNNCKRRLSLRWLPPVERVVQAGQRVEAGPHCPWRVRRSVFAACCPFFPAANCETHQQPRLSQWSESQPRPDQPKRR